LGAVVGSCWVAAVPGLAVIYGPTMDCVWEGLLQIDNNWPANTYFDELPLVDKKLEVVATTFTENLCAHGGFESVSLGGLGFETFWI